MDIKRNKSDGKEKHTTKKEIKLNDQKKKEVQLHFGNIKVVELKLLETICKNTAETVVLLRELLTYFKERK